MCVCLLLLRSLIPWTRESPPFLKRLRVSSEERLLASSCPPVFPLQQSDSHLNGFSSNLIFGTSTKIYRKTPNLVNVGHKYRTVQVHTCVCVLVLTYVSYQYTERTLMLPWRLVQYLLRCWPLNMYIKRKGKVYFVFMVTVFTRTRKDVTFVRTLPTLFIFTYF